MDFKTNAIHGLKLNAVQVIQQSERTFTQIFFIPRSTADLVPKTRRRWFLPQPKQIIYKHIFTRPCTLQFV